MEEMLHLFSPSRPRLLPISLNAPSRHHYLRRCLLLLPPNATHVSIPKKTTTNTTTTPQHQHQHKNLPTLPPPREDPNSPFREKMLFLDSIGIDLFALTAAHPPIVSASLHDLKSTVHFLHSMGFTPIDLRRIVGMCPEVLTTLPEDLTPVFTFLLREARVQGSDLRRVINRRPRLLVSDVTARLRPTLYFLQMLGITDTARHATLLSCSVEDKLLPRIEFLLGAGFSPRDARSMVRRFPQMFCYSIEKNLEPKFDFFAIEMGRDLKELKEFPQYFSFSLQERIRPRHRMCKEKGVYFTLPALLKPGDEQFMARLEVCDSSSPPLRNSPLWHENLDSET